MNAQFISVRSGLSEDKSTMSSLTFFISVDDKRIVTIHNKIACTQIVKRCPPYGSGYIFIV
jgi:hypothetical protein